ncbi:hypothetical protein FACS1894132_10400 [Clostridia bacterium]|nr:hypothetical protein FACS1894132_10400 [Clostridia bacterium]
MKVKTKILSVFLALAMSLTAVSFNPVKQSVTAAESIVYGDVDDDGDVGKIADVVLLGKHVAGKLVLKGQNLANANCDVRDNAVDVADLQTLIKYMLKQITSLPYGELPKQNAAPQFSVDSVTVEKDAETTVTVTDDDGLTGLTIGLSNEKIASVSLVNGVVTIIGLAVGETILTVWDSENETDTLTITVINADVPVIAGTVRNIATNAFVAEMHAGWNLGNTLDAWNDVKNSDPKNYQESFETLASETSWGNPKTSQAMMNSVKAAGFDFVRIPTTWHNHFINDQFTIDPDWMDRVQTIVNYAISIDLKVILNTHHEGSVIIPTPANEDYDKAWITAVWTQIGTRFQDYGDALIFEGLNEPRTEGTTYEWQGGTSDDRAVVNRLNQTFVDIIRSLNGNNKTRFLLAPSYAAGVDNSLQNAYGAQGGGTHFEMPNDPANHTIAEIHAYTPWGFAGSGVEEGAGYDQTFDNADKTAIDSMFSQVKTNLLDKGYSVIIDEFGTRSRQGEGNLEQRPYDGTSRVDWIDYYITKARALGIPCCTWDDGGWFVQLDRTNLTWYYPTYLDKFLQRAYE